jgi:hypothetical protein
VGVFDDTCGRTDMTKIQAPFATDVKAKNKGYHDYLMKEIYEKNLKYVIKK